MFYILFPVGKVYFYSEFGMQMLCQMLCRIDGTMLSAGTTERDHQIRETTVQITFHRSIHDRIYMFQELRDFPVFLQEVDHWLVQSCKMVVSFIFSRVVDGPAIEYETTAVSARIVRYSFFVGKADDLNFQHPFLYVVPELRQAGQFSQNGAQVRIFRIIIL